MNVPLYTDHNIRRAVVEGLRRRDGDVLTARANGAAEYRDERLRERAPRLGRALLSQDRDLPPIANRWLREGRDFAGLISSWVRTIGPGWRGIVAYTIFDTDTGNAVESFTSEDTALDAIRTVVNKHGRSATAPWILVARAPSGERSIIAEGEALYNRAFKIYV